MAAPSVVHADGGDGGGGWNSGVYGGTGGAGYSGEAGQTGTLGYALGGGGGGGGAAGGGAGGDGGSALNSTGGTGGASAGANGGDGQGYRTPGDGSGGGGGGGGGANDYVGASTNNGAVLTGGNGGNGGNGGGEYLSGPGGGGGGEGGYGAVITDTDTTVNSGSITGGNGGNGGSGGHSDFGSIYEGRGGNGGDGGVGIQLSSSGASLNNTGLIAGGAGGLGGASGFHVGLNGLGGAGVVGSGLTIINSGTISGGFSGDGTTRANAITFTGGDNTLTFGNATSGLTGNIDVTGTLAIDQSSIDTTVDNVISGSGSLKKTGTSTVTLSGDNTYSGGTTISAGTLRATNDSSLGTGTVTLDGGTLQAGAASLTFSNDFAVNTAGGTIDTNGGNDLTLGGISDGDGTSGTLTILNSGLSTGIVRIGAPSDYSGATIIGDGTGVVVLQATAGANHLSGNSAFTVNANAILNTGGNDQTIGSLAGSGTVQGAGLASQTLTTGGDDRSTTFSGVINDGGGTLALTKEGTGTFTLSGTNSYTGGTTVTGGTLAITSADALGSGDLALEEGTTLTLDGTGIDLTNNITVAGDPTFTVGAGNTNTISGVISDGVTSGDVVKDGDGTLILSALNDYTGGTAVSAGTLAAGSSTAFGTGGVSVADTATLDVNGQALTIGSLSGEGTVTNDDATAGSLATGSDNSTTAFSGTITDGAGTLALIKQGTGTFTLSGVSAYTGTTDVDAGTLNVEGSIASSSLTTVKAGAKLIGMGTVGDLKIASGGTFVPGAAGVAGGTTTVTGTLTFDAGSTYLVAINPTTASYADVSGTAALHGTVHAAFDTGTYVAKQYTILQSAGLGNTTFDALTISDVPAGLSAQLDYTSTDVLLDLTAVLGIGENLNGNQQSVAGGLNTYFNNGGALSPNFLTIFGLTGDNLSATLSSLSGEVATGGSQGGFRMMGQFLGLMSGAPSGAQTSGGTLSFAPQSSSLPAMALSYAPIPDNAAPSQGEWQLWSAGFGGWNRTDGNAVSGTNTLHANTYGFAAGADYQYTPDTVLGFALSGGRSEWDMSGNLGGGDSDAVQIGLHGATRAGPAYISAALGAANHWMTTERYAVGDLLKSDFKAQIYSGRLEAGYAFQPLQSVGLTPYAAFQVQHFRSPEHTEDDLGGGGFALSYDAMHVTDTRTELGTRIELTPASSVKLTAGAAWAHDNSTNPSVSASFLSLPGSSFVVRGASHPDDLALVSAGAAIRIAAGWTLSATVDSELASGYRSYAGSGTLRYEW